MKRGMDEIIAENNSIFKSNNFDTHSYLIKLDMLQSTCLSYLRRMQVNEHGTYN